MAPEKRSVSIPYCFQSVLSRQAHKWAPAEWPQTYNLCVCVCVCVKYWTMSSYEVTLSNWYSNTAEVEYSH